MALFINFFEFKEISTNIMPNTSPSKTVGLGPISIGTMPATALAAISAFQVVLLGKDPVSLPGQVIISLFQGNVLLHVSDCLNPHKVRDFS